MRKRIATTALALMAAMAASLAAAAPAFADDHFDMTVRNTASGMCLTPQGESSADGVPIVQVTCNGSPFQRWDFVDHDDHIFQIRNAVTLKCMDVLGRNNNGTPVVQWPCSGISNERFQASRDLPDFVSLRSRVANTNTHCIDDPGGLGTEGAAMQLWVCNGTPAQAFGVFPV
ncbi:RICIN domain-containing protein [Amycolatopsis sp. NPDC026612]|uniref:RICIN domain-containing protein n=1 Tax=Amycolatopsis sp. NPDC026612 TaxID=3155466 RepID=UPI0033C2E166